MQNNISKLFIPIYLLFLSGCANNYKQFYFDQIGGQDVTTFRNVLITESEPKIIRGSNKELDLQRMREDGYMLLGYSNFNAASGNDNDAIVQAKEIHASTVIIYSKYTNTVTDSMPIILPSQQTTTSSAIASNGLVSAWGTANTTNYGTSVTSIPYNVNRSDFFASYFVKLKPAMLGLLTIELTAEIKKELQSNKGALVKAVLKDTPAYNADFLKDDVIRNINGIEISNVKDYSNAVTKYAGQKVVVKIYRSGKELQKEVQLNRPNS